MKESKSSRRLEKRVVQKPDGRYLILYSRPEEQPEAPSRRPDKEARKRPR
jgi:hypothetical protein